MTTATHPYTIAATTPREFADAVETARVALADEGFGVLCEIDVQATLAAKLAVEREPYLILGACNPPYAHQGLERDPELGALLPCNVAVYVDEGITHVAAVDPTALLSLTGRDDMTSLAEHVHHRLQRVVDRVAAC